MNDTHMLDAETDLREIYGTAEGLAVQKSITRIDRFARQFISLSPFLCLATANGKGKADVSPRGDPPGFVQVIDDKRLLIPDRPGNNRLDTMVNIVENPNVAAIFFVPGFEDTLRVVGRAAICDDTALLARSTVNGKAPKAGILVSVEEVFFHCAKALKRSKLWQPDYRVERRTMPSIGRMILAQTCESEVDESTAAQADEYVEANYKNELY